MIFYALGQLYYYLYPDEKIKHQKQRGFSGGGGTGGGGMHRYNHNNMNQQYHHHSSQHINKLYISFAILFTIVSYIMPSPSSPTVIDVVSSSSNKNKADKSYKHKSKTVNYYLQNFGANQILTGNTEETKAMVATNNEMINYMKEWIDRYDHVEKLKERWYVPTYSVFV